MSDEAGNGFAQSEKCMTSGHATKVKECIGREKGTHLWLSTLVVTLSLLHRLFDSLSS